MTGNETSKSIQKQPLQLRHSYDFCPECFPFLTFTGSNRWNPPLDIRENDNGLVFKIDLPEIPADDVNITVQENELTITGEKKDVLENTENIKYHRREIAYGKFKRTFTLPDWADTAKIKAVSSDGILTLSIPKAEKQKPKKVTVNIK